MFTIDIGTVLDDVRYVKKSFDVKFNTVEGVLRDECDVITPIVTMNIKANSLAKCNYVYIPTFGRYYYITNMVAKTSTLTELHLKCDVLMSNWKSIYACYGCVDRQEYSYDAYLDDEKVMTKYPPAVVTLPFENKTFADRYVLVTSGGFTEVS